jgi:hypothetical protein
VHLVGAGVHHEGGDLGCPVDKAPARRRRRTQRISVEPSTSAAALRRATTLAIAINARDGRPCSGWPSGSARSPPTS